MNHLEVYKNWTSFFDHLEHDKTDLPLKDRSSYKDGEGFTGTESYAESLALARGGWKEGVEQARRISGEIESRLYNVVQYADIAYDVTGEMLDVGRFVSGEPEHWGNWEYTLRQGQGTKHIHIVMNVTASGGIDKSIMMARGSAIAALITLLEMAGHRVKLETVWTGRAGSSDFNVVVGVKEYDESLDIDRVTFACAHPSYVRRHCFHAMEFLPKDQRDKFGAHKGGGYGTPVDSNYAEETRDIYIPKMHLHEDEWRTIESATAWVNDELVKLGVLAKELTTN